MAAAIYPMLILLLTSGGGELSFGIILFLFEDEGGIYGNWYSFTFYLYLRAQGIKDEKSQIQ